MNVGDLDLPAAETLEPTPVTDEDISRGVAERDAWLTDVKQLKRTAAEARKIEIASSRERAYGPLAAEVATFDAALVIGQGSPMPIGDAVHMVMERITLPGGEDLEQVAGDVCLEGDIAHDLPDVISMCRACLGSPSVKRAIALGSWWRDRLQDRQRRHRGHPEQYAREHPGGQGEVCQQALATATGLKVREVALVYCKAGAEVRRVGGEVIGSRDRQQSSTPPVAVVRRRGLTPAQVPDAWHGAGFLIGAESRSGGSRGKAGDGLPGFGSRPVGFRRCGSCVPHRA